MAEVPTELTGWGAHLRSSSTVAQPEAPGDVIARMDRRGTIARGLGRSYGDPALNAGGQVMALQRLDRYLGFDPERAVLSCEAGASLAQIIRDFAPRGFFPLITPGTKYVTIGGCIANDVHGKAHHVDGSFNRCVESMTIGLADGQVVRATRRADRARLRAGSSASRRSASTTC